MVEAAWRRRFRAPRVTLPTWARDEPDRLLYASNATGTWEIYAWDRATRVRRRVTDRPEGTLHGRLDPAARFVFWFDDEKGSELGRWRFEAFEGGDEASEVLGPDLKAGYSAGLALAGAFSVLGTSIDDRTMVHVLDRGGEARLLYEHREDAEVAGLSRDEGLLCIGHAEHGDSRHPALRVVTVEGETVADLWDGPGRGLYAGGWSRVPGDRRLLVVNERKDLPRPMLWWPETGETQDLDIDLPGEIQAAWYPDGAALLLAHDYRARVELYRFDLSTGSFEALDVPPGTVSDASVRPDGEVWYAWSDAATPAQVRSSSGQVVLEPEGEAAPAGVRYEDHAVGDVPVLVAKPQADGPNPVILSIHGGPTWHDRDSFSPLVQAFVDHGFAVVLVNYRGSTGYGKAWRDALERNPGLTELEDIAAVHDWLSGQPWADRDRMVLSGASWGGYLTLLGLGTQPERWALGIAAVPVADYVAAYQDEMEPLRAFDRSLFGGSPEEIPDEYAKRSPITYAREVWAPVLVLAGENDPRCPIRQIDNYLAVLRELGIRHEVYRYDAGHGSLVVEESIKQTELELDFASRHLGTLAPL